MESDIEAQYRKAGPALGAYIGCMWIVSFVCMANTLSMPFLSLLGMGIGIGSLMAIVVQTYLFRWKNCSGDLTFFRAWVLILQIFFYASILMAFGVFIYMKFFDNGNFSAYYEEMLSNPTTKLAMDQILSGTGITSEEFVTLFSSITPINLAMNIMESNILLGFFSSVPLALLSRIKLGLKIEKIA